MYVDIARQLLELRAEHPGIERTLRGILHGHLCERDERPLRRVEFVVGSGGASGVPEALRASADALQPVALCPGVDRWYTTRATFECVGAAAIRCTLHRYVERAYSARFDRVIESDASPERFYYRYLDFCLKQSLLRAGVLPIHAGYVADPARHRRWMLVGKSRSGKTTLCAGFLDAGWLLLTDDAVLLSIGDGRCRSLRRPMHVDRRLAAQLPGFACIRSRPPYLEGRTKVSFEPRDAYGSQAIDELAGPTALVFPRLCDSAGSTVRAMHPSEARETVLANVPAGAAAAVAAIESLIASVPAFAVDCGRDAADDPRLVPALLERTL